MCTYTISRYRVSTDCLHSYMHIFLYFVKLIFIVEVFYCLFVHFSIFLRDIMCIALLCISLEFWKCLNFEIRYTSIHVYIATMMCSLYVFTLSGFPAKVKLNLRTQNCFFYTQNKPHNLIVYTEYIIHLLFTPLQMVSWGYLQTHCRVSSHKQVCAWWYIPP